MCTEKCRHVLTPKKFLYCWSLQCGSVIVGLLMCLIMVVGLVCTGIYMHKLEKNTSDINYYLNYSVAVVAVMYFIFMICLCPWFIWGVIKKKSSVVLSWLAVTSVWLAEIFVLLLFLLFHHIIYEHAAGLTGWLIALIFGLIAIGILTWCLLVVRGYWIELKEEEKAETEAT